MDRKSNKQALLLTEHKRTFVNLMFQKDIEHIYCTKLLSTRLPG